ncbi:MAG: hypothetical protein JNM19_01930 [Chitinophagaceae bacterium]|nr:hypothetical protein [Chitinophagaceae bacterium]
MGLNTLQTATYRIATPKNPVFRAGGGVGQLVKRSPRAATATRVKTAIGIAATTPGQSHSIINFFGCAPKILIFQPSPRAAAAADAPPLFLLITNRPMARHKYPVLSIAAAVR